MTKSGADHTNEVNRINRMIGQLGGVKEMIKSGTYCPKILIQTKAVSSALRGLETTILKNHINHCVKGALKSGKGSEQKISELIEIFKTRIK